MKVISMGVTDWQVVDDSDHHVAGPFATNADAWGFVDRTLGEKAGPPRKPARQRRVRNRVAAKPGKRPKAAPMTKRQKGKMMRAAAKAPRWVRSIAATKFDPNAKRAHAAAKLGTFGAASEVRRIDPAVYLAERNRK